MNASHDTRSSWPNASSDAGAAERREYEHELLYGEVIEHLRAVTQDLGLTQRELARRLQVSEARMSRIMTGRENLTLRTLADLGWAVGLRFEVVGVPVDRADTPATHDGPPPRWLLDHARLIAQRVHDALRRP